MNTLNPDLLHRARLLLAVYPRTTVARHLKLTQEQLTECLEEPYRLVEYPLSQGQPKVASVESGEPGITTFPPTIIRHTRRTKNPLREE